VKDVSSNFSRTSSGGNIPRALESNRSPIAKSGVQDSLFKEKLQSLQNTMVQPSTPLTSKPTLPSGLKFSNHAIDRMQARGVRFTPEELGRIENAVSRAEGKGAKNTLLLTDGAAMIVSIKDKTVVTVMDKNNLKENVFTNIDSTVVV
jgi:flagellar operon protein